MKSFDTELKKYTKKIHLKVSERNELRERIFAYMEYHPLPKQVSSARELKGAIISESFTVFNITLNRRTLGMASGFLLLFLIIIPIVAERSVPGDVLYLVKTGINESVQGQLVSSPYEKIEFETRLMERRIAEARLLANEGRLTDEMQVKLAETVKEHSDSVQNGIQKLKAEDADGAIMAQIAYSSALEVQSAVLDTDKGTENTTAINSIVDAVNTARDAVTLEQGSTTPSFDGLMARTESETTRAYELFTTVKTSATSEEVTDIERRLSDINRLIVEAKEKQKTDETVAIGSLTDTLKLAQKLILFMTNIDVRASVSLESIVPVVLSKNERIEQVKKDLIEIEGVHKIVEDERLFVDDVGVSEKVQEGMKRVDDLTRTSSVAIGVEDIGSAESGVREAKALISDLQTLVHPYVKNTASTTTDTSTVIGNQSTSTDDNKPGTEDNHE